ncbi:MAG: hypothetical protein LJE94_12175 [Deltaproteobacteria bacterium]|nr:hypothetical protein [Deltaproteobacteria bacterium]
MVRLAEACQVATRSVDYHLAAGNPSGLALYPGGIHAFNLFPIEIASQANARMEAFLNECLANRD